MADLNYPDHFYADALNQKPTGAYDARKLREETIATAQRQDRADPVTKPAHYQRAGIETIDYIRATLDGPGFESYCIGNVLKYVSRHREKGGIEDLRKARVYLGWAIEPTPHYEAPSAEGLATRIIKQHPMAAEALRVEDRL